MEVFSAAKGKEYFWLIRVCNAGNGSEHHANLDLERVVIKELSARSMS